MRKNPDRRYHPRAFRRQATGIGANKVMLKLRCLLLLCFVSLSITAKERFYFNYSTEAKDAYDKVLSFRFREAQSILNQLKVKDPYNLVVHHIENYMDLFSIYSGEGGKSLKEFKRDRARRLEQVRLGDQKSPYYFYVQAEIMLHSALVKWKYSEYLGAFQDITRANRLLNKNYKLFPKFIANQKDLGLLHTIIGTIPSNYKWGIKLISGLNGTIDQGMRELSEVLASADSDDFVFKQETQILYALLMLYIRNDRNGAWDLLQTYDLHPKKSSLHCYILANVAMMNGKNDVAIRILENRPEGNDYFPFHQLDFMLGLAKLRSIDTGAKKHFEHFLNSFNGQILIKSTYQKLAWLCLIEGNTEEYNRYIKLCLSRGSDKTEEDKIALAEAESGMVPEIRLLKARLLFDGGYYEKAATVVQGIREKTLSSKKDKLEHSYRQGRIYQSLGRRKAAIQSYLKTIETGTDEPYYFACNAALQIGQIYEKEGSLSKAEAFFRQCLQIKPKEYRNSLHHQAKSGLKRIEEARKK